MEKVSYKYVLKRYMINRTAWLFLAVTSVLIFHEGGDIIDYMIVCLVYSLIMVTMSFYAMKKEIKAEEKK